MFNPVSASATSINIDVNINFNIQFKLPGTFRIKCGCQPGSGLRNVGHTGTVRPHFCPSEPEEAEWTVSQGEDGKATIDLGDKYSLELNENKSQIIITNKETGEKTNIWGDPHVDWNGDGKTDADFWGKTTFQLEDGTKITIDTEKWNSNDDMYVANDITITKDDKAIQITGLSQNEIGDMEINQSNYGGQVLDWAVTDGFVVQEHVCGEGWINPETGELATQEDFDVTKPGAVKPYEFSQIFGQALGLFLTTGVMDALFSCSCESDSGWREGTVTHDRAPNDGLLRPQVHTPIYSGANGLDSLVIMYMDGSSDIRTGGSLSWRTNNPGLLHYNAYTRNHGAIGEVDGVAVFADLRDGQRAHV